MAPRVPSTPPNVRFSASGGGTGSDPPRASVKSHRTMNPYWCRVVFLKAGSSAHSRAAAQAPSPVSTPSASPKHAQPAQGVDPPFRRLPPNPETLPNGPANPAAEVLHLSPPRYDGRDAGRVALQRRGRTAGRRPITARRAAWIVLRESFGKAAANPRNQTAWWEAAPERSIALLARGRKA